ncbi:DUF982 domain-containing protein [Mesorhizobium sp. WSM2239]|uniref:DUF982 domain-containing protein n=2 Tax=unclassified Mesorhizobium TaxID=325217 RepID=A0AAU8D2B4_9HYPH
MESGPDKPFQQPVRVSLDQGGEPIAVRDTRQAADLLLTQWPASRGPRHRDAVDACLKVLDGHRSTIDAYDAFRAAAEEAGVLAGQSVTSPG